MLSRRMMIASLPAMTTLSGAVRAQGAPEILGENVEIEEFESPGLDHLDDTVPTGVNPPTEAEKIKAKAAIDATPFGPRPYDVAKSFITRFAANDPDMISQWPRPAAWNPIVRGFFDATSYKVSNDMVDWCAAFANWCLERNKKPFTNNAGSQSFITDGQFAETKSPKEGDLVVFTCYRPGTDTSLGLGHVGFYQKHVSADRIMLLGGNQSGDRKSIISEKEYSLKASNSSRTIGGVKMPVVFKFNQFLSV